MTLFVGPPRLEVAAVANPELEPSTVADVIRVTHRNRVIEPQRADGQVQTQTDSPVVGVIAEVKSVGTAHHVADVVEQCEAHAFDDRDTVLSRAEPGSIAADRLQPGAVIEGLLGTDIAVFVSTQ